MLILREGEEKEKVSFNITRRDSETGEVEARLKFSENMKISEGASLDVLKVIIKEDIEIESYLYYAHYYKGQNSSRMIPS